MPLSSGTLSIIKRAFRGTYGENFNKTKGLVNEKKIGSINEIENDPCNSSMRGIETPTEIVFSDLIQILEVNPKTTKMLHGPSLNVFILKTVSNNAEKDKKRLYNVLNLWKKLTYCLPENLIAFQNIFYYSNLSTVQICLNHTNLYPLKVALKDSDRHSQL